MSVMFQEEVSKLKLKIVELQEAVYNGEQNHQRLADLLTGAKQQLTDAESKVASLEQELENTKKELSRSRGFVDRVQNLESEVADANTALNLSREAHKSDLEKLKAVNAKADGLKEDLSATKSALDAANDQIAPLEALVSALMTRETAQRVIQEQLSLLGLDRA